MGKLQIGTIPEATNHIWYNSNGVYIVLRWLNSIAVKFRHDTNMAHFYCGIIPLLHNTIEVYCRSNLAQLHWCSRRESTDTDVAKCRHQHLLMQRLTFYPAPPLAATIIQKSVMGSCRFRHTYSLPERNVT